MGEVTGNGIRTVGCAILGCVFAVGLAWYAVYALNPPRALPKDAPPDQFSAYRAIDYAFACSMSTHPAGSKRNDDVAQFLIKTLKDMGVEVEFMAKPDIHGNSIGWQQAVIGRIPGTASTGAIAFSAHYDSVPYGPGATDDIAGCIAMLEAARTFMNLPRMRNDLVFVFADAEEIGGNGARGFCTHPLAKTVGVMTEMDVRGTKGPALIYETSDDNAALIAELRKATDCGVLPVSSSLMVSIYKASPFGSDFTRFKNAGMKGYNLAYIDKFSWYHTANDSPEHISPDSIQHFGAHVMGISKHFGGVDFAKVNLKTTDAIYFNVLGFRMIQYSMALGGPLAVMAVLTFLLALAGGLATKRIAFGGYLKSLLMFPVAAVLSAAVATAIFCVVFGYKNVVHLYTVKLSFIPEPSALYDGNLFCYALGLTTVAIAGFLYTWAGRRLRVTELQAAAMTWFIPPHLPPVGIDVPRCYLFVLIRTLH